LNIAYFSLSSQTPSHFAGGSAASFRARLGIEAEDEIVGEGLARRREPAGRLREGAALIVRVGVLMRIEQAAHGGGELLLRPCEHLEDPDGLPLALDPDDVDLAADEAPAQGLLRRLGDQELTAVLLGRPLQAGGEVHVVADHRVVHPLLRPDVAAHHLAGGQPDADLDRDLAAGATALVEGGEPRLHLERRIHGADGVGRRPREGRPEDRHDRVADELVEDAAVLEDDVHHHGEVVVEHLHDLVGADVLR
jgi:hypothetical protein